MWTKVILKIDELTVCLNDRFIQYKEEKEYKNANDQIQQFTHLMTRAEALSAGKNLVGLRDLLKVCIRPLQYSAIREPYINADYGGEINLGWAQSFNIHTSGSIFKMEFTELLRSDICQLESDDCLHRLNLATVPVLTRPWRPDRLLKNLGVIGEGLIKGPFEQEDRVHDVCYNYPFDIGWVGRSKHSIAAAIIRGEGEISPCETHDYSPLIKAIKFDGLYWRCIGTNRKLGKPDFVELGWIWEIGRLIIELELQWGKKREMHVE